MPEKQAVDELRFSYPLPIDASMSDEREAFYPSAYQNMIVGIIEQHLVNIGMEVPLLVERYGVSWFLLAMSVELARPLRQDDHITARTWCSGKQPPLYRREFALTDDAGETVAVGAAFSSILDLKKRHICTDPAIYAKFDLPEGETRLAAVSRFTETPSFALVERRVVRPSWIDYLGHMNNSRYGDLVCDALSETEREALRRLRRLDVWFLRELTRGMTLDMEKASSDGAVYVRGVIQPEKRVSFVMKLTFENA